MPAASSSHTHSGGGTWWDYGMCACSLQHPMSKHTILRTQHTHDLAHAASYSRGKLTTGQTFAQAWVGTGLLHPSQRM